MEDSSQRTSNGLWFRWNGYEWVESALVHKTFDPRFKVADFKILILTSAIKSEKVHTKLFELRPALINAFFYCTIFQCVSAIDLCIAFPREEQGIKEFDDEEFLTRKIDKENKELTSIKIKDFFGFFLGRKLKGFMVFIIIVLLEILL